MVTSSSQNSMTTKNTIFQGALLLTIMTSHCLSTPFYYLPSLAFFDHFKHAHAHNPVTSPTSIRLPVCVPPLPPPLFLFPESSLPDTPKQKGITFPPGVCSLGNKPPLASCWAKMKIACGVDWKK